MKRLTRSAAVAAAATTTITIVGSGMVAAFGVASATPTPVSPFSMTALSKEVQGQVLPVANLAGGAVVPVVVGNAYGISSATSGSTPSIGAAASNLDLFGTSTSPLLEKQTSTAPPTSPLTTGTFLPVNLSPVADVEASTVETSAAWDSNLTCLAPGSVISHATIRTAGVSLLGSAVPLPGLDANQGVANIGAVTATEDESLPATDTTDPNQQFRTPTATSSGSVAGIDLLYVSGVPQVHITVSKQPSLTAAASGKAGGSSIVWQAPEVTIQVVGQATPIILGNNNPSATIPVAGLATVTLGIGSLNNVVQAADGTHAAADAYLLNLQVALGSGSTAVQVANVNLVPMHADVTAPVGGVDCTTDPDHDGYTTGEETTAGTDPYNTASHPSTPPSGSPSGGSSGTGGTPAGNPSGGSTGSGGWGSPYPGGAANHCPTGVLSPSGRIKTYVGLTHNNTVLPIGHKTRETVAVHPQACADGVVTIRLVGAGVNITRTIDLSKVYHGIVNLYPVPTKRGSIAFKVYYHGSGTTLPSSVSHYYNVRAKGVPGTSYDTPDV